MRLYPKIIAIAGTLATIGTALAFYAAPGAAASSTNVDLAGRLPKAERQPQTIELAQAAQPTSALPGGASSLNETYQDWQVTCLQQGPAKRCALSQSQAQQNGQRVLAIELGVPDGDTVSGILVLPFGLALASGATLQIDDNPAGQPLSFRTCLPVGCVLPVSFDAATVTMLRAGVALKVKATSDGGQEIPFSISLQGFAGALDRVAALAG